MERYQDCGMVGSLHLWNCLRCGALIVSKPQHNEWHSSTVAEVVDEGRLRGCTDARVWAEEFVKVCPDVDEGLMIGWFANAIETSRGPFMQRVVTLQNAIDQALNELGVPSSDYPAPVANAFGILDDTRKNVGV